MYQRRYKMKWIKVKERRCQECGRLVSHGYMLQSEDGHMLCSGRCCHTYQKSRILEKLINEEYGTPWKLFRILLAQEQWEIEESFSYELRKELKKLPLIPQKPNYGTKKARRRTHSEESSVSEPQPWRPK